MDQHDRSFFKDGMPQVIDALGHVYEIVAGLRDAADPAIPALPDRGSAVDQLSPAVEYLEIIELRDADTDRPDHVIAAIAIGGESTGNEDIRPRFKDRHFDIILTVTSE